MADLQLNDSETFFSTLPPDPYPGLRAFYREEADIFFGRDEQIDGILERLQHRRMVVIAGESGCGKSSLVRAGVVPALEAGFLGRRRRHGDEAAARGSDLDLHRHAIPTAVLDEPADDADELDRVRHPVEPDPDPADVVPSTTEWRIAELRPGRHPIHSLAEALARALLPEDTRTKDESRATNTELLAARLRHGPRSIAEILSEFPVPPTTEILILVDQFEELIRFRKRIDLDEADAFVALLLETVADKSIPARVVLTLRTDYLGACAIFPGLPEAINASQYLVPRLDREQLRETIVCPARLFLGDVDSRLANRLINEVSQRPDQLPVLEHALLSMWKHSCQSTAPGPSREAGGRPRPCTLTLEAYTAPKGIEELLSRHASQVYDQLQSAEHQRIARRLFCALRDEGDRGSDDRGGEARGSDTRRPCTVRDAAEIAGVSCDTLKQIADVFRKSEHSFLMPSSDRILSLADDTALDVCHESLFRHWEYLRSWIQAEAEDVKAYQRWCDHAAVHRQYGNNLLRDQTLALAIEWRDSDKRTAAWAGRYSKRPDDFEVLQRFLSESQRAQKELKLVEEARVRAEQARTRRDRRNRRILYIAVALTAVAVVVTGILLYRNRRIERKSALQKEQLRQQHYSAAAQAALRSRPVLSLQLALEAQGDDPIPAAEAALHGALRSSRLRSVVFPSIGKFRDAKFLAADDGSERLVTVGAGDGLAVWDARTGRRLRAFYGAPPSRVAVAASRGIVATASSDGSVDLWELDAQRPRWSQHLQIAEITSMAFSPDNSLLATASEDGSTVLWDVASGDARSSLIDHLGAVKALAFSHDGERLATAGEDGRVVLWDTRTGKKLGLFARLPGAAQLAFQATGRLIAISTRNRVVLLDPITQREEGSLIHASDVASVAFSPDGKRIATTSNDGELRVWNASDHGQQFSVSTDVLAYNSNAGAQGSSSSPSVAFSPDGRELVTIAGDGNAQVWEIEAGGELRSFPAHSKAIRRITYDQADRIATASDDGTAAIWDRDGRLIFRTPPGRSLKAMDFAAAGTWLAVSDGNALSVWNVASRPTAGAAWRAPSEIKDIQLFHTTDRIAVASGRSVGIWSIRERQLLLSIDAHVEVGAVAVSPDDRLVVSECAEPDTLGSDRRLINQLCFWDTDTGSQVRVARPPAPPDTPEGTGPGTSPPAAGPSPGLHLSFSRNGIWLASSHKDKAIQLWNVSSRQFKATIPSDRGNITGLALGPDGRMLASSSDDRIRLWDTRSRASRDDFPDVEQGADSVAFSHSGAVFAAGGHDGVVRIYPVEDRLLQAEARNRLPLHLTNSECDQDSSQPCQQPYTALQLANEARRLLRDGSSQSAELLLTGAMLRDPASFGGERERIASAHMVGRAMQEITAPIDKAVVDWSKLVDAHRDDGSDPLIRSLQAALDAAPRRRSERHLAAAASLAPGIVLGPVNARSRIEAMALARAARVFVHGGLRPLATATLALVPHDGRAASWAQDTSTAMDDLETVQSISTHLASREYDAALGAIKGLSLRERSPQRLVVLRSIATACDDAGQLRDVAKLAERLYPLTEDVEALLGLADILLRTKRTEKALAALHQALDLAPTNDQALLLLARAQYQSGQLARADATLRNVSPFTPVYKNADDLIGMILYERERVTEGYRSIVVALDNKAAASSAQYAEAAWAAGRFDQARQMARRVLEAHAVEPATPDVELAMRFVLVAALCQAQKYLDAEDELKSLVELAPSAGARAWRYTWSRTAVTRIKDAPLRRFLQALLSYSENRGRRGDPNELYELLHEARDAHSR